MKVVEGQEGILVVRKGKAGTVIFREKGKYALTDDAYFLTPNPKCKYSVSLKWIIAQYRQMFFEYSSSSLNGTWNMTDFFARAKIDIPERNIQDIVTEKVERLEAIQKQIATISSQVGHLYNRQIVLKNKGV